ncbi:MAG: YhfC family glutamic-type intramembrane protease, partial [Anaerolineae bacterium]
MVITIVAFLLSLSFQVLAPVGLAIGLRRRIGGSWRAFLLGAVIFGTFNLLTWQPLSTYLDQAVGSQIQDPTSSFFWLVMMAGAGAMLEEGGRWLGFRWLFPQFGLELNPPEALMSGLGHAAIETSLLIAGLTFMHLTLYLLLRSVDIASLLRSLGAAPQDELVSTLASLAATRWDQPLWIALDRAFSVLHQLAWSVLVA